MMEHDIKDGVTYWLCRDGGYPEEAVGRVGPGHRPWLCVPGEPKHVFSCEYEDVYASRTEALGAWRAAVEASIGPYTFEMTWKIEAQRDRLCEAWILPAIGRFVHVWRRGVSQPLVDRRVATDTHWHWEHDVLYPGAPVVGWHPLLFLEDRAPAG